MSSNLAREVSELERNVDRLTWALQGMIVATEGMEGKARQLAINLLEEIKHENMDYTVSKKQNDGIRGDPVNNRGTSNLD